jgi:hypothetical protein
MLIFIKKVSGNFANAVGEEMNAVGESFPSVGVNSNAVGQSCTAVGGNLSGSSVKLKLCTGNILFNKELVCVCTATRVSEDALWKQAVNIIFILWNCLFFY